MVQNPNGEFGGFGWVTPVAGSYVRGSGNLVQFTTGTSVTGNQFSTEKAAITAGQYVGARWYLNSASFGYHRARFRFWATNKTTLIANGAWASFGTSPVDGAIAATVAPAGTFFVDLEFEVGTSSGTYPMTLGYHGMSLRNVVMAKAATAAGLGVTRTNLLTNPSFETNTTGWFATSLSGGTSGTITRVAVGGAPHGSYVGQVENTTTGETGTMMRTDWMSATPGQDYTFTASVRAVGTNRSAQLSAYYRDANGALVGQSNGPVYSATTGGWTRMQFVFTVPANATEVLLRMGANAGVPPGTIFQFDAAMLEVGFTIDRPFIVGSLTNQFLGVMDYGYVNIIGPTAEIATQRESLNLSTLNATVLDIALDPATGNTLRPGRKCRLLVLNGTKWEPIFTGKLTDASVQYELNANSLNKVSRITITAVDNVSTLANAQRPDGVGNVSDLPHVLEGAGVPWNVNGNGNQVPTATIVSNNDNASALDQIAITRDSKSGYAWVDRFNTLQAWDASAMPSLTNTIPNPSFETTLTSTWAGSNCTVAQSTTYAKAGSNSLRATATANSFGVTSAAGGPPLVIKAGQEYKISGWYRTANVGRQIWVSATWFDASGGFISGSASTIVLSPSGMTDFAEVSGIVTAPVNAGRVSFGLNTTGSVGDIVYWDSVSMTANAPVVDETVYAPDIDVSFSTGDCINEVVIKNIEWDDPADSTKSVENIYPAIRNEASITEWGRYSKEFTTHGLNAGQVSALGASILAKNANPTVRINAVSIPIRTLSDLGTNKALIDQYQLVTLVNTDKGLNHPAYVTSVAHTITPKTWTMRLAFSNNSGVAAPTQTPPVQSISSAVNDAAVSYAAGVQTAFGGSRVYRRPGIGMLTTTFNLTAAKAAGAVLMTVPAGYEPVFEFQCVVWNISTAAPVSVSIRPTGEVIAQVALTSGHNFSGSLSYPRTF